MNKKSQYGRVGDRPTVNAACEVSKVEGGGERNEGRTELQLVHDWHVGNRKVADPFDLINK
jgi:hypothetical protein